jgi:predicted neuraminidase
MTNFLNSLLKGFSAIALILCMTTLSGCSQTQKHNIPSLAKAGEGALISAELIYPLDGKPTVECHASTIAEIDGGGLIAAWFGGSYEKHQDVGIWVAFYDKGSWSKPIEVANGFQHDSLRYPTWNPVLFKPTNGPLMLFYKVGPSPREWWGMLTTSEDNGRSWSTPRRLGNNKAIGDLLGPVKNKPVQLNDGTILCPSSIEIEEGDKDIWKVHFEATRDFGKTWEVIGPINDGVAFAAIQPSILKYKDGRLQILARTQQKVIGQSWSSDNGKTWSKMSATELPNPNAGTDAVTLKDGRQLLVYNHAINDGPYPKGREIINVAISSDGTTWKPVMTLERQQGEFSYPAVIQTSDGLVHITYTYQRLSIKHLTIDPSKLK